MPVSIRAGELKTEEQEQLTKAVSSRFGDLTGEWMVFVSTDPLNNAWDASLIGPGSFHWERRFSGFDRDVDVIAEAMLHALPKAA